MKPVPHGLPSLMNHCSPPGQRQPHVPVFRGAEARIETAGLVESAGPDQGRHDRIHCQQSLESGWRRTLGFFHNAGKDDSAASRVFIAESDRLAVDQYRRWILPQPLNLPRKLVGFEEVVAVKECQKLSAGLGHSAVTGAGGVSVSLANQPKPAIGINEPLDDGSGVVRAAIIHDDALPVFKGLVDNALKRLRDDQRAVVGGDDDADRRHAKGWQERWYDRGRPDQYRHLPAAAAAGAARRAAASSSA